MGINLIKHVPDSWQSSMPYNRLKRQITEKKAVHNNEQAEKASGTQHSKDWKLRTFQSLYRKENEHEIAKNDFENKTKVGIPIQPLLSTNVFRWEVIYKGGIGLIMLAWWQELHNLLSALTPSLRVLGSQVCNYSLGL